MFASISVKGGVLVNMNKINEIKNAVFVLHGLFTLFKPPFLNWLLALAPWKKKA